MAKEIKFKIRGAPVNCDLAPKIVTLIAAALDKLPDGDLIEGNRDLASEIKRSPNSIKNLTTYTQLAPYRAAHPASAVTLWGNRATIAAFRKQFQK
jgi:hypothetical protein